MMVILPNIIPAYFAIAVTVVDTCAAFSLLPASFIITKRSTKFNPPKEYLSTRLLLSSSVPPPSSGNNDDDDSPDPDSASLASELIKMAQAKGVSLEDGDLLDDDYDDDYDDNGSDNIYNVAEDNLGNENFTDDKLYTEVRERVLDTAGGFVEMVRGPSEDDDEDEEDGNLLDQPKVYVPPEIVPDPELTAGEVVLLVIEALKNNDTPTKNKGVEILFGYSSPGSQIKNEEGLTAEEYCSFLKETGYEALFDHLDVSIEKGEYSNNGKKGYFTARLQTVSERISCNFILSAVGTGDDAIWLIDSMLIRPKSMRRRRRK